MACDCGSHGTHTLGTMVGLDRTTNDTIGVAFNALWVGAPILCGLGTEDNVAAFEWALDPDNNPETIVDMPDVINNSWFDPNVQNECNNVYNKVLDALEAAGVAVIFSAGNAGPEPSTITPPHNINTDELNSFTVGALNGNSSALNIADFSSRGPAKCTNENEAIYIKPEVSAPGVSVRSCVPGGYDFFSGTSMAAPHVAGAVLLLKEAFPFLTGRQIKESLYLTAIDLGDPGEDNTYGRGIIDAEAAFHFLVEAGHVPVDPRVNHDLMLVDVKVNEFECDREVTADLIFENAGMEPITSFDIDYSLTGLAGLGQKQTWTGNLLPGERTSISLPALVAIPGSYELVIEANTGETEADQRPLNNLFKREVRIVQKTAINLFTAGGQEVVLCQNTPALLQADYTGPGTVRWYDAEDSEEPIGTGVKLVTEPLEASAIFYADVFEEQRVGKESLYDGPVLDQGPDDDLGLVFNATSDMTVRSVKVYAKEKGARIVALLDNENQKVAEKVLLVRDTGEQRVEMNLFVPAGNNYQLVLMDGKPLLSNEDGVDYPYEVDDQVTIKWTNHPIYRKKHYYYFFDWDITYDNICGRQAIAVEVNPDAVAPLADFSSAFVVEGSDSTGLVGFQDQSEGAIAWIWDFGDGNTSEDQNPQHEYTEVGSYLVSLTVISADGCANVKTSVIEVLQVAEPSSTQEQLELANAIGLFPNPSTGQVQLSLNLTQSSEVEIELIDVLGRSVLQIDRLQTQQFSRMVDLTKVEAGIYFIAVQVDGVRVLKKLLLVE
ncbi:MAG: S8 family serine peptidase [Bacteroidota bacterium]